MEEKNEFLQTLTKLDAVLWNFNLIQEDNFNLIRQRADSLEQTLSDLCQAIDRFKYKTLVPQLDLIIRLVLSLTDLENI